MDKPSFASGNTRTREGGLGGGGGEAGMRRGEGEREKGSDMEVENLHVFVGNALL
jgi:hypothetical protein